jgi:hypothetical protein
MKNKIPSAIAVLVIISSLYFEKSQAQSIQLIANPDSGYVEDPGIIYNNKLFFGYRNASGNYLSQYDGTAITLIPNPDMGGYSSLANVYNNKLYFGHYSEIVPSPIYLAQYDGTSETVIPCPNAQPDNYGFAGNSFVLNSKLYFIYRGFSTREWQFAQYNDTSITLIPNPNGTL